jgi:hypothetical protein
MPDRWAIPVRKVADLIPSSPRPLVPEPEEMAAVRKVAALFWLVSGPAAETPVGPTLLDAGELTDLRRALQDAINYRLPDGDCADCPPVPTAPYCAGCQDDHDVAVTYQHLLDRFGGAVR